MIYTYTGPVEGVPGTGSLNTSAAGYPAGSGWKQIALYHTHPAFNVPGENEPYNLGPFSGWGEDGGDLKKTPFGQSNFMIEPNGDIYELKAPVIPTNPNVNLENYALENATSTFIGNLAK